MILYKDLTCNWLNMNILFKICTDIKYNKLFDNYLSSLNIILQWRPITMRLISSPVLYFPAKPDDSYDLPKDELFSLINQWRRQNKEGKVVGWANKTLNLDRPIWQLYC